MRRPYIHFFHIRCFSRDRLLSITAISLTTEIGKSAYRSSDNPEVGLFGVKLTYNGLPVDVASSSCPKVSFGEIDRYFKQGQKGKIHSSSMSGW